MSFIHHILQISNSNGDVYGRYCAHLGRILHSIQSFTDLYIEYVNVDYDMGYLFHSGFKAVFNRRNSKCKYIIELILLYIRDTLTLGAYLIPIKEGVV